MTEPAAALEQTQQRGWALDDEESTAGMRCLAAAVFDEYGEAVAGISVSGPLARLSDAALPGLSDQVRGAAAALTETIGDELLPPSFSGYGVSFALHGAFRIILRMVRAYRPSRIGRFPTG